MCRRGEAEARSYAKPTIEDGGQLPQAYQEGFIEFRGLKIEVDERVLVPRPESELLVEEAITLPPGSKVHEVGTGSGAIALSISNERRDITVTASDIDPDAVEVAKKNADALGIHVAPFACQGIPPGFLGDNGMPLDMLVANLPYLTPETIHERDSSVLCEPGIATMGANANVHPNESDGLACIRGLLKECPSGTLVALEHDTYHGSAVRAMLHEAVTRHDYNGDERMTVGLVP